jgi:ACS family tartrate transporter-like MFS transporter
LATLGLNAYLPVFWCIPSAMLRGSAAAGAIALINSVGNLGGLVGPNLLGQVKQATGGFSGGLAALAGIALTSAVLLNLLTRRRPG